MKARTGLCTPGLDRLARSVAGLLLLLASSGLAGAEGEPPQLPQVSDTPMQADIPAAPASVDELVARMDVDAGSPARFSSQDFVANQDDSQGADDFCIPAGEASWTITNVDVVGGYNVPAGYSTGSVKVFFMAHNAGHLPGTGLYTATVTGPSLANAGTGMFAMTLTPPAQLAGNNCYWLSVQAAQPGGFNAGETWQWTERTAATTDHSPSAYRLPGKPGHVCQAWGARLATCFPSSASNPDFTLRLSGSVSTNNLTPQITSMSPLGGLNEDINLTLTGLNFALGAVVSWTVGVSPTQVFTATVADGSNLTVNIPAASVGPQGSTATVRVNNPASCQGACFSNEKIFTLQDFTSVYLPIVRR